MEAQAQSGGHSMDPRKGSALIALHRELIATARHCNERFYELVKVHLAFRRGRPQEVHFSEQQITVGYAYKRQDESANRWTA